MSYKRPDVGNLSDTDEEPETTHKRQKGGQTESGQELDLMSQGPTIWNKKANQQYVNHEVNPNVEETKKYEAFKAENNKVKRSESESENGDINKAQNKKIKTNENESVRAEFIKHELIKFEDKKVEYESIDKNSSKSSFASKLMVTQEISKNYLIDN